MTKITHVSQNSGNNEWYTPKEYVEAARSVMGSIDTDPASSLIANEIVKATQYFTEEQNGITKEWKGNVWMNPPYAQPLISQFTSAVTDKFISSEIDQAVILVNNATETKWFQKMLSVASCGVCFLKRRIKFLNIYGEPTGSPLQGQCIIYFGNNINSFYEYFSQYGSIFVPYDR
ncbi:MAG: DNA N-6-adenine-methyltransferase [Candidatus Nomurabacteria bacterium]|nr:DNA N-6-adenine-methyltransferase [Candidatus Nomurabacteria bacterium]